MKKPVLLVVLLCHLMYGRGQNLVTNGSFETKAPGTGCPFQTGFGSGHPTGWSVPFNGFTPDYFFPCDSPGSAWYPGSNSQGCEYPLNGQSYTGLLAMQVSFDQSTNTFAVHNAGSEYMMQTLSTNLTAGQQYYVEFWVSPGSPGARSSSLANNAFVKTLGMFFTRSLPDLQTGAIKGLNHLIPQVPNTFPAASFYTNTNGWTKISGTYTPSVSAQYHIVIGNFDSGLNATPPNPSSQPTIQNGARQSYYYIDAVTIIPFNQTRPDYTLSMTGTSLVCSNSTYTIQNQPFGTTITWTQSSNLTPISGQGTTNYTVAPINGTVIGPGFVQATLSGVCSGSNVVLRRDVWMGQPTITYHPPGYNPCFDNPYYEGPAVPGLTYQWSVDNPNVWFTSGTGNVNAVVISINPEYFNITLTISGGGCQTSATLSSYTPGYYCQCFSDPSCGGFGGFSASPNPANTELTIEAKEKSNHPKEYEISILDHLGNSKKKVNAKNNSTTLDVSTLPEGTYYLHIKYMDAIETKRIVIKR